MSISYLEELDKLEDLTITEEKKLETSEDFRKGAIDLFSPLQDRLDCLEKYYEKENETLGELISCIIGMFFFSKTNNLREYLSSICTFRKIPIIYRIESAKSLENGYTYINMMFEEESNELSNLPTPVRVDTVLFLMDSNDFMDQSREYFCKIISDMTIEDLYRYRTIQRLENKFSDNKDKFIFFAREASKRFLRNQRNLYSYRVLAGQYLLEKCAPTPEIISIVQTFLLEVAEDPRIDEDIRADACDVLLQYGDEESRIAARNLLFVLGGGDMTRNNIFKNAQNVHIKSIEESIQKIVDKLVVYYPVNGAQNYDFKTARDEILKNIQEHPDKEAIEGALTRIMIDRAVYGNNTVTLSKILAKIWTYIQDSSHKEELQKRLNEELIEAYNKCSTGYAGRLVNTLAGFTDDMNITISFEDQIIANLEGRLNSKIRDIQDEDFMEKVIMEMTIPVHHFSLRTNFLKFFRENISKIREGMYDEFRHFMTDIDYDMYFRKAIMHYEGVF